MNLRRSFRIANCCGSAAVILCAAIVSVGSGSATPIELAFLQPPQPPRGSGSAAVDAPRPALSPEKPPSVSKAPARPPTTTRVAPGDDARDSDRCLTIAEMGDRDRDLERNQTLLSSPGLCMRKFQFSEGTLRWTMQVIENRDKPNGFFWFVPHDDENAGFDTAAYGVTKYGGTVVSIDTNGNRMNGAQDPNRNFDAGDAASRRCKDQVARSPIYTEYILRYLQNRTIVALHSNKAEGSISIRIRMGSNINFPARTPLPTALPDHTVAFVASTAPPSADPELRSFVAKLNAAGANVIYETVSPSNNDCSMSNYAALKGIRNYVNLEVVHGDSAGQRLLLDSIMPSLKEGIGPLRSPAPVPVEQQPAISADAPEVAPAPSPSPVPPIRKGRRKNADPVNGALPPAAVQTGAQNVLLPQQSATNGNPSLGEDRSAELAPKNAPVRLVPPETVPAQPVQDTDMAQAAPAPLAPSPVRPPVGADRTPQPAGAAPRGQGFTIRLGYEATETDAKKLRSRKLLQLRGLNVREDEIGIRFNNDPVKPKYLLLYGTYTSVSEGTNRCTEMLRLNVDCAVMNK